MNRKFKITQIASSIGRNNKQKKILIGLGLNKIRRSRIVDDNNSIKGMINKVKHLVKVEEILILEDIILEDNNEIK